MINELFLNRHKLNSFIQQLRTNSDAFEVFKNVFNEKPIFTGDNDDLPF